MAAKPTEPHYVLNGTSGEVLFGDGVNGLIPVAGSAVIARKYQYGGGLSANVGADMITLPFSAMTGVASVTNERPAVGGNDEQSLDNFLKTAPARLRRFGLRATSRRDRTEGHDRQQTRLFNPSVLSESDPKKW